MKVKINRGKKQTFILQSSELVSNSIVEIIEDKTKNNAFVIEKVNFNGDKCRVTIGNKEEEIIDIDEEELMEKSIKQVVKDKLKLKTIKGIEISIIKPMGK